jgi:predicted metal-dependent hydrolase
MEATICIDSHEISRRRNLGEFVIVHEVVHIIAPNHGKVFKSFMLAYLPDWQERERMLRDHEREKMISNAAKEESM